MSEEETVEDLRNKLESQAAEFENYKAECKQLEEFLEEESKKKEDEIRKLKEEAIKKEKNYSTFKNQVQALETENAALKGEIEGLKQKLAEAESSTTKLEAFQKEIEDLKSKNSELETLVEELKAEKTKLETSSKPSKGSSDGGDKKKIEEALSSAKSKISELEKQNERLKEELKKSSSSSQKVQESHKSSDEVSKIQRRLSEVLENLHREEEKNSKLTKQIQNLYAKIGALEKEKEHLIRKNKEVSKNYEQNERNGERNFEGSAIESHVLSVGAVPPPKINALLLTKKHYVSPFLELKPNNEIHLFKSTKNGCFEKSLGVNKYRVNAVEYSSDNIVKNCVENIRNNVENGLNSSVVFFGPKKTTKKYLLAALVKELKDFILEKIEDNADNEIVFSKDSADPEKKVELTGKTREEFAEILDQVVSMAQKSQKKSPTKKTQPKSPKTRYLKLSLGDLHIEIITSSYTSIPIRESQSLHEVLNNVIYSKISNALVPQNVERYIVIMLNPVVAYYEECKNMLQLTGLKRQQNAHETEHTYAFEPSSPSKEELNNFTRRKLENIERETEQNLLKMRKQEEEILFYKSKFDELELRLKNLLNTHREHNTYLKKSPITLSYEKMLRFVHGVQNAKTNNVNLGASKVSEIYGYEDDNDNNDYNADEINEQEHEEADGEKSGEEVL